LDREDVWTSDTGDKVKTERPGAGGKEFTGKKKGGNTGVYPRREHIMSSIGGDEKPEKGCALLVGKKKSNMDR